MTPLGFLRTAGCVLLSLAIWTSPALAQRFSKLPPPLRLSGTLTAGFYHADTEDGVSASHDAFLSSVRLDLSGYIHHPKFLLFDIKPQMSLGRQSTETIFPDGRGVSAVVTFLSGNSFPLTVSYSRLGRQVVSFGALDRLAGLSADSSQSSLTLNWQLRFRRLPRASVSYSRYSDNYEPLAPVTSQFKNRSRVFSVDLHDNRAGWLFDSQFRVERSNSDLLDLFAPSPVPFQMGRDVREFRASASRDFSPSFNLNLYGGHTNSDNQVADRLFDQGYSYFYGNARWRHGKKLAGNVRAGATTNLIGYQLAPSPEGSAPPPAPSPLLLNVSQARVNLFTLSSQVQYSLSRDFRLDGELNHDSTWAPRVDNAVTPTSRMIAGQAGLFYSHDFRRWKLQSRYAFNVGRLEYNRLLPSRTLGHVANVSAVLGSWLGFELTTSAQGQWQSTQDSFRNDSRIWGVDLSATRRFSRGWNVRLTYGYDQSFFGAQGSRFDSHGNSFGVFLGSPKLELSLTRQVRDGLNFQPDLRLGTLSSAQARTLLAAFPNLRPIASGVAWTSAAATLRPTRRLTVRFQWVQNSQDLAGRVSNRYVQWESTLGYQFRRLYVDAGYVHYDQSLGFTAFSRNRFFVRVVREFRAF